MWTSTWTTLIAIAFARLLYTFMILTCSSIRLTTHLIRIILTHALTFYARFRALGLFCKRLTCNHQRVVPFHIKPWC